SASDSRKPHAAKATISVRQASAPPRLFCAAIFRDRPCGRNIGPMDSPPPSMIFRSTEKAVTETKAKDIEALCAAKGMRMTEQRRTIARVLAAAEDHPDVEELYRRCAAIDDRISISTVYRTVKLFEDSGIIERHDFRAGRARYEQIPESHHDH